MDISVCVGSSCHLKGSYNLIELFKEKIKELKLEDTVNLRAAFCLGKCTNGVTIKVDDNFVCGVSEDNFNEIFDKYVLLK